MDEESRLELELTAKHDQLSKQLHENFYYIDLLARVDPGMWSEEDKQFIRGVLYAVLSYIQSKKV